jgi:hypothetical protein
MHYRRRMPAIRIAYLDKAEINANHTPMGFLRW